MADSEAVAHYERGNQLRDQGDLAGAEEAWHAASQGSHHGAALNLGDLLYQRGELERAENEWSFAAGADDPGNAVRAITSYGRLISETEFSLETTVGKRRGAKSINRDTKDADALWRLAAESGDAQAAWAYIGLGRLYDPSEVADEPDPARSEVAFERAAASDHRDAAPCAMLKLGRLRKSVGHQADGQLPPGAIEALERGFDSGHPEWAPRCANQLAHIYANQGDIEQAENWYRAVAESGHSDLAPYAEEQLVEHLPMEDEADVLFDLPGDDAVALDAFDGAMHQLGWRGELEAAGGWDFRRRERGPHRLYCLSRGGLLSGGNRINVLFNQTGETQTSVGLVGGTAKEQAKLQDALRAGAVRAR